MMNTRSRLDLSADPEAIRTRIDALERLLERMFIIPGLNRPIGLDVILDVIPVAGDAVGAALGAYLIWEARRLGLSRWQLTRMAGNVGIDLVLGLIPWVGAIPDFLFRSNSRNIRIIHRHLDRHHPATATIEARGPNGPGPLARS